MLEHAKSTLNTATTRVIRPKAILVSLQRPLVHLYIVLALVSAAYIIVQKFKLGN
jgi:hypothetical protein